MFITTPRNKKEFHNLLPYIDAFLFGINNYSVNFSNNFDLREIEEFNRTIKQNKKQIFVSLNKNMHNNDIEDIKEILTKLNELKIDGLFFMTLE